MYTALLVDDELWALAGLKGSLDWQAAGFRVIYETTNSIDALDAIVTYKPDVVFTDIRMPVYSGIDLIERCREQGIASEFVIVSGYAEFEYAKEAMKYGAFDYLLKPIKEEELGKLASRLFVGLSEKALATDNWPDVFDNEALFENAGTERRYSHCAACVVSGSPRTIGNALASLDVVYRMFKTGRSKYLLLLNFDPETEAAIHAALGRWAADNNDEGREAGICETRAREGADWQGLVEQAFKAYESRLINGDAKFRTYVPTNAAKVKEMIDFVFRSVGARNAEPFREACRALPDQFRQRSLGIDSLVYFNNGLSALLRYKHGESDPGFELETESCESLAAHHKNMEEYAAFLYDSCVHLVAEGTKGFGSDADFGKLLDYIQGHFSEEMYLSDLAREFHLNPTYLCELFRKKTGRTFTKYMTDLRMDNALQFMKFSDMSMSEIAGKVGFNDYFYFSKLFKKNFGVSPAQYRKGG